MYYHPSMCISLYPYRSSTDTNTTTMLPDITKMATAMKPHPPNSPRSALNTASTAVPGTDQPPAPLTGTGEELIHAQPHMGGEKGTKSIAKKKKAGRPKGSKSRSTLFKEAIKQDFFQLVKKDIKPVIERVILEAKDGNMVAAKLIMDKIIPNAQPLESSKGASGQVNIIISDMKAVEISEKEPLEADFKEIEEK